ncbi:MAG: 16S rRNA (guanine(527)-N(7))-methyltransferase RsmG [Acidobacteriia bacterium]|nr:16S rRNA (guanine(527)-N(7))-methyltransferase RsmG [Terriglobia bacterium]
MADWQVNDLEKHFLLLERWNKKINLTRIEEVEKIVVRHYCESIAMGQALPFGKLHVMDAGSGPGFPGIPLAITRPDCIVNLVESDGRKATFLREAVLEMRNCRVIRDRLENVVQETDWVVGRAVRWQDILLLAERVADHVGLMVGVEAVLEIVAKSAKDDQRRVKWDAPIQLPWGDHRFVLLGHFPSVREQ